MVLLLYCLEKISFIALSGLIKRYVSPQESSEECIEKNEYTWVISLFKISRKVKRLSKN